MVGLFTEGDLTQEIFESEQSYPITYYDNPLQPGIAPRWSDQNVLGGRKAKKKDLPRRELNFEEFQRRQKHALAMLENAPADPMAALEEKYRSKMLAMEHKAAAIAEQKRCQAIRGQDIYEEDAELDCNDYADFLAQEKGARDGASHSAVTPVSSSGGAQDVSQSNVKPDCKEYDQPLERSQAPEHEQNSMMTYESQGTEKVLGFSSDGVLFVAKGGKVLRNEGPPMPPEPAQTIERSSTEIAKVVLSNSHCFPFNLHGCSCFQLSMNGLRNIFHS